MYIKEKITLGGRDLTIESGKIAKQANGSVMVSYGDTVLMATVCCSKQPSENRSFFPLSKQHVWSGDNKNRKHF